ncbi:hypothetical protein KAR10_07035, partial [bacterium]|nr:hypothetical protein [bacterium]
MNNKKTYYVLFAIGICMGISCAPSQKTIKSENFLLTPTIIATPVSNVLPVLSEAEGSEAEGSEVEGAALEQSSWIEPSPEPTPKIQPTPFSRTRKNSGIPVALPGGHEPEDRIEEEFATGMESDQAEVVEHTPPIPPAIPGKDIMLTPTPIPSVVTARGPISTAETKSGVAGWLIVILIAIILLSAVVYLYWRQTHQKYKPEGVIEKTPSKEIQIPSQYETTELDLEEIKPAVTLPEVEKKTELQPEAPVETKAINEIKEEPKEIEPVPPVRINVVRRKKVSRFKIAKKAVEKT